MRILNVILTLVLGTGTCMHELRLLWCRTEITGNPLVKLSFTDIASEVASWGLIALIWRSCFAIVIINLGNYGAIPFQNCILIGISHIQSLPQFTLSCAFSCSRPLLYNACVDITCNSVPTRGIDYLLCCITTASAFCVDTACKSCKVWGTVSRVKWWFKKSSFRILFALWDWKQSAVLSKTAIRIIM